MVERLDEQGRCPVCCANLSDYVLADAPELKAIDEILDRVVGWYAQDLPDKETADFARALLNKVRYQMHYYLTGNNNKVGG